MVRSWLRISAHIMHRMTVLHITLLCCTIWSRHIPSDAENTSVCAREPPGTNSERQPGDGGFRITVDSDSHLQHYVPERVYRVSITGTSLQHTLSGAYLAAVPYNTSEKNVTVGKFHLVDGGRLAFPADCLDIVTTVDSLPKAGVHVMWRSPARQSGCVQFSFEVTSTIEHDISTDSILFLKETIDEKFTDAVTKLRNMHIGEECYRLRNSDRATVIENQVWYKDDGALTKVLCPEQADYDNTPDTDVSSKVDCCACGTAKYQLTFHSLWSQSIHVAYSRDVNMSRFHWSSVVGSSHSEHYTMWRFNTLASEGVSDICQFGDTRSLEDEIRHQSSNIRTVIKTPGMRWTREHGLQQQRWAHFSVDRKHHLLSVLSRLSPSPDWCVGVSALDLCLDNCTWLADTSVQLFAWDAGVSSSDSHALEHQPISRLPGHADSNPGLPFRGGKPMEPVAVLRLHRFDPSPDDDAIMCSSTVAEDQGMNKVDDQATEVNYPHQKSCVMGLWSQWSGCSASCGTGTRTRTRTAVIMTESCAELLQTTSEPCKTADCVAHCELHEWSEWSPCSDGLVLCSPGDVYIGSCSRHRTRSFRHTGAEAFCSETVEEEEPCQPSDTGIFAVFNTDIMSRCFSPAESGPCERNLLRWYYDASLSGCQTFLYSGCRGNANRYTSQKDCMQSCRQYEGHMVQMNKDTIGTDDKSTNSKVSHSGISKPSMEALESDYDTVKPSNNVRATVADVVDCVMSPWSGWSSCSVTCGRNGVRTRLRTVRHQPSGGGKKCPRRKLRRRRCSMTVCVSECQYTNWSPWSPCARSCGADTVQERIRQVQETTSHSSLCPVKLQRRICSLPQCFEN